MEPNKDSSPDSLGIRSVQLDGLDCYLVTDDGAMHWLDGCDAQGQDLEQEGAPPTHFKLEALATASTTLGEELEDLRRLPGAEYSEYANGALRRVMFSLEALRPYLQEFQASTALRLDQRPAE